MHIHTYIKNRIRNKYIGIGVSYLYKINSNVLTSIVVCGKKNISFFFIMNGNENWSILRALEKKKHTLILAQLRFLYFIHF